MSSEFKIYAPFSGTVEPIAKLDDGVFSEKMLGDGFFIKPNENESKIKVVSPIEGTVEQVFDTKHAIFFKDSSTDLVVLMHFGLDTVTLGGSPFKIKTKAGKKVKQGGKIMIANLDTIRNAELETSTPVVVDKGESDYSYEIKIVKTGEVNAGDLIATVTAKK